MTGSLARGYATVRATTRRGGGSVAEAYQRRLSGLDAVRFAAAMLVFMAHVPSRVGTVPELGTAFVWGGNGVSLFFALSGYLLWRPFVTGRPSLRSYLLSRAGRILPAYWLAVLVLVPLRGGDIAHFLLMQPDVTPDPLGILWTLQAEVMFYAALPALALIRRPLLVPVVLGAGSLLLEFALVGTSGHGSELEALLPVRFWSFAPGMILAAWRPKTDGRWLVAGFAMMFVGAITFDFWQGQWTDVPSTIGAGLVVGWGMNAQPRGQKVWAAGAAISYGIYLWHVDLTELYGLAGAVGTFLVAGASYVLLERPIMRLVSRSGDHRRVLRRARVPGSAGRPQREHEAAPSHVAV